MSLPNFLGSLACGSDPKRCPARSRLAAKPARKPLPSCVPQVCPRGFRQENRLLEPHPCKLHGSEAMSGSIWCLLLALCSAKKCTTHEACPPTQYCFSYSACRSFMAKQPFSIGDLVSVAASTCLRWVVLGSFPNSTYHVECSNDENQVAAVERQKLLLADGDTFRYDCGEFSSSGVCGPLQLCPSSRDSIDDTCPGAERNKSDSWLMG